MEFAIGAASDSHLVDIQRLLRAGNLAEFVAGELYKEKFHSATSKKIPK